MNLYAIILAAGDGKRLGFNKPKCFIKVGNQPIYKYSINTFLSTKLFKQIVLVVPKQYVKKIKIKGVKVVAGGKDRNESFELGLKILNDIKPKDRIFVHDAARMYVIAKDIINLAKLKQEQATLCYKNIQTRLGQSDLKVKGYNIQTPQYCSYEQYLNANVNPQGKDLFTYLNLKHKAKDFIISSNKHLNFKITELADLAVANLLI